VTHSATRREDSDGWYLRDEWFSIDRTGEINQLTHFEDYFTEADIEMASISPNGRYLAFWLSVNPSTYPGYNLAVLDLETRQVVNYCIPGSPTKYSVEPVWSPDSRYIALVDYYDKKTSDSHVILVDPAEEWAARVAENLAPLGWMIAP
jgi:Tol biopolymer transport system component